MARHTVNGDTPSIHDTCFVAPSASVIGDTAIGRDSSVWPHASIRADSDTIVIGERTSIQDNAVLHTAEHHPVTVGDNVTIGHQAVVHGCTVEDAVLIGMNATVLSGAHIGEHCVVAAGAVVTEDTAVPAGSMVMGIPGKVVRELTGEEVERIRENAQIYVDKKNKYLDSFGVVE